jgi:hypothetical protein
MLKNAFSILGSLRCDTKQGLKALITIGFSTPKFLVARLFLARAAVAVAEPQRPKLLATRWLAGSNLTGFRRA